MKTNKYHISKRRFITDALSAVFSTAFFGFFIIQALFIDEEDNIVISEQQFILFLVIWLVVLIGVLILVWIVMRRHVFYEKENQFVVEKGLIVKRKVEIPYEHIHTISLKRNILHMILGVTKLQVDTGAIMGVVAEADLLLRKDYAEQLKYYLEHKKDDNELSMPVPGDETVITKDDTVFYKAKWYELWLMGLLQSWVFIIPASLLTLFMYLAYLQSSVIIEDFDVALTFLMFLMIAAFILLFTSFLFFLVNYGYQLKIEGDYIEYQYGLINRVNFKLHKKRINALTLKQPLGYRLFKYYALEASVIGIHAQADNQNNKSESQYLMPIVKQDKLSELLEMLGYQALLNKDIKHPHKFRQFNFVYLPFSFILVILAVIAVLSYDHYGSLIHYISFLVLTVAILVTQFILYFKQHGYQMCDDKLLIQQGVFTLKKTLVKYTRIQSTKFYQGPVLLLEKTGHIHIVFKGLARNRVLQYFEKEDFESLNKKIFNI